MHIIDIGEEVLKNNLSNSRNFNSFFTSTIC